SAVCTTPTSRALRPTFAAQRHFPAPRETAARLRARWEEPVPEAKPYNIPKQLVYVRRLMGTLERDIGRKVEWAAVNHYDTSHPQARIVVRGVDRDGRELRIDRGYILPGMRWRAGARRPPQARRSSLKTEASLLRPRSSHPTGRRWRLHGRSWRHCRH